MTCVRQEKDWKITFPDGFIEWLSSQPAKEYKCSKSEFILRGGYCLSMLEDFDGYSPIICIESQNEIVIKCREKELMGFDDIPEAILEAIETWKRATLPLMDAPDGASDTYIRLYEIYNGRMLILLSPSTYSYLFTHQKFTASNGVSIRFAPEAKILEEEIRFFGVTTLFLLEDAQRFHERIEIYIQALQELKEAKNENPEIVLPLLYI